MSASNLTSPSASPEYLERGGMTARFAGSPDLNSFASEARLAGNAVRHSWDFLKRGFDIALCVVMLVAILPLFLLVAIAVKLDSRGPVLFRQRRLGRDLHAFSMLKFRTMYHNSSTDRHRAYIAWLSEHEDEQPSTVLKKLTHDTRVTRVGRFLRKTSLDELPQLLNVLAGQMSLIGPRPALDYELEHYALHHFERFEVRPGLSGLWQVSGRNHLGFHAMLELDVQYVRTFGWQTDARIFVQTPVAMLRDAA